MTNSESYLLLRLMVEVATAEAAEAQLRTIRSELGRIGRVRALPAERYWKFPEYWELTLRLTPRSGVDAWEAVLSLAPAGWTTGGGGAERWAVWNPAPGAELLTPAVRWANAEWPVGEGGG